MDDYKSAKRGGEMEEEKGRVTFERLVSDFFYKKTVARVLSFATVFVL